MSTINEQLVEEGRFAVTFLDIENAEDAINDEFLVDKITGEIFYKNKLGAIVNSGIMGGGLDIVKFHIHIDSPGDTFTIPKPVFSTDFVLAILNSVAPHQDLDYTVVDNKIKFAEVIDTGDIFGMIFRKTITGTEGSVDAKILAPGTLTSESFGPDIVQVFETINTKINEIKETGSVPVISETEPAADIQREGSFWLQPRVSKEEVIV